MPLTVSEIYYELPETESEPNDDSLTNQLGEYKERVIHEIFDGSDLHMPIIGAEGTDLSVDVVAPTEGPYSYVFSSGPGDPFIEAEQIEKALADPRIRDRLTAVLRPGDKHSVEAPDDPVIEGYIIRSHDIISHYFNQAKKVVSDDALLDNINNEEKSILIHHIASLMTLMNARLMLAEPCETHEESVDYAYGDNKVKKIFIFGIRNNKKVRFETGIYGEDPGTDKASSAS